MNTSKSVKRFWAWPNSGSVVSTFISTVLRGDSHWCINISSLISSNQWTFYEAICHRFLFIQLHWTQWNSKLFYENTILLPVKIAEIVCLFLLCTEVMNFLFQGTYDMQTDGISKLKERIMKRAIRVMDGLVEHTHTHTQHKFNPTENFKILGWCKGNIRFS